MTEFDEVAEVIRVELAKGAYQMPYDGRPYETKSKIIAQALLSSGVGSKSAAWDSGNASGWSNAMRRMSDEPAAPITPNPYRPTK